MLPPKPPRNPPKRQLASTILHFDYDCFYASVFEHQTPALKALPLAVQQKQIIVTCNYEARRRGLSKLQLISEAKKLCPDLVIVLGEDLTPFRNASKELYAFFRSFSWNSRCERLGFDEVFMDVSDIIDVNVGLLNSNDLSNSFFCLSKIDPTVGFPYDASKYTGHVFPQAATIAFDTPCSDTLHLRMLLASHLALYLRKKLESEKGYTATVGVSTNKLLAKLVGNLQKPNGQTTLLPPYSSGDGDDTDNVTTFMDDHEVGKIPGIGFKIAQKLRAYVLDRPAEFDAGLIYGATRERVHVRDVRQHPGIGPDVLERVLGGPGVPHGIGAKVWNLINGCDDSQVGQAREIPRQISIEDSYLRLDSVEEVTKQLHALANSLLARMHTDLLEDEDEEVASEDTSRRPVEPSRRWLAQPRTIRLSTRPRPPQNPDGSRNRSFARISKSAPLPMFIFSLKDSKETLVPKLVSEVLIPLFRKLHPEKTGWNLSLVNVAVTNMAETASDKGRVGRDIGKMFRYQEDLLRPWKVEEEQPPSEVGTFADAQPQKPERPRLPIRGGGSEDAPTPSQEEGDALVDHWESEDEDMMDADVYKCHECGALMPLFAMGAHERWHVNK